MHPFTPILRFFFHHLYHGFAWAYDPVAGAVSLGRWNEWVRTVAPLATGTRVLELGHGPGHLQCILRDRQLPVFGLDESTQMGRLAAARLRRQGYHEIRLARGRAQSLPFAAETFDTILSTFPSEYIFDSRTLAELSRTLKNGGRLIVLPVAWPENRLLAWLFRVTVQSPSEALELATSKLKQPFVAAGFEVEVQTLRVKLGKLLIILSRKPLR